MGKGHRDNHRARVKRGLVAFEKKAERRTPKGVKCFHCGIVSRAEVMTEGYCPICWARIQAL